MADDGPLACPTCARRYGLDQRFCADDGMPLVYVGRGEEEPITAAHERARKVKPQYTGGDLVKVAWARNLAEAELIQGMFLEEGIPSTQRRTRGFDVPDFLAAGPRDVLVPESAAADARGLLTESGVEPPDPTTQGPVAPSPARLLAGVLVALLVAGAVVWLVLQAVN